MGVASLLRALSTAALAAGALRGHDLFGGAGGGAWAAAEGAASARQLLATENAEGMSTGDQWIAATGTCSSQQPALRASASLCPISARSPLTAPRLPRAIWSRAAGMIVGYAIISVVLVIVSGLMAGLVLGLLSLDK